MTVWVYNGVEFNIGDRVRVVRFEQDKAPNGMGEGVAWGNTWQDTMDQAIGFEFEVFEIDPELGVLFCPLVDCDFPAADYGYPLSVLQKV